MPTDPTNMNSPTLTGGNTNASYVNLTSGAYPNIEHMVLDGKDWVVVNNTLGVEIYELNPTTLQFVDSNATTAGVQPTFSYSDPTTTFRGSETLGQSDDMQFVTTRDSAGVLHTYAYQPGYTGGTNYAPALKIYEYNHSTHAWSYSGTQVGGTGVNGGLGLPASNSPVSFEAFTAADGKVYAYSANTNDATGTINKLVLNPDTGRFSQAMNGTTPITYTGAARGDAPVVGSVDRAIEILNTPTGQYLLTDGMDANGPYVGFSISRLDANGNVLPATTRNVDWNPLFPGDQYNTSRNSVMLGTGTVKVDPNGNIVIAGGTGSGIGGGLIVVNPSTGVIVARFTPSQLGVLGTGRIFTNPEITFTNSGEMVITSTDPGNASGTAGNPFTTVINLSSYTLATGVSSGFDNTFGYDGYGGYGAFDGDFTVLSNGTPVYLQAAGYASGNTNTNYNWLTVSTTNLAGAPNAALTQADLIVQGANTGENMPLGYTDADGTRITTGNDTIYGNGGNDTISADAGNDSVFGGTGDDRINGGAGNDTISGDADNDYLAGGDDADTLYGGTGNDTLSGELGNDVIYGGDGNDVTQINGDNEAGDDTIYGGLGNDTLGGGLGNDWMSGDEGDDALEGADGADTISGGIGNDYIAGFDVSGLAANAATGTTTPTVASDDNANDVLSGGEGNDTVLGGGGSDTLEGGAGEDRLDGGADGDSIGGGADNDSITGGTGNDTLHGDGGDDTVDGGLDNDAIFGGDGLDSLLGGAGNDTVNGGAGNDTLNGDDGDDALQGELGNDLIYGGAGNDLSTIGADNEAGDDTVHGGAGNDTLAGGLGNDSIFGDEDNDAIEGGDGADTIDGGTGNDYIAGFDVAGLAANAASGTTTPTVASDDNANDVLSGGEGNDTVLGGGGNDTLDGGAGNDRLDGGTGDDSIAGGADNDSITAGAGNDSVEGGTGDDTLDGGADNDTLRGGDGVDLLLGGVGADLLDGGIGNDSLDGGDGNDSMLGQAGNDSLSGGIGDDTLDGGADNDALSGGEGADGLHGGTGNDTLDGGAGNDSLYGDLTTDSIGGADSLIGGAGDDLLNGGAGNDTLDGGADNDFVFGGLGDDLMSGGTGTDTLYGDAGNDSIDGGADNDSIEAGVGDDVVSGGTGNDVINADIGSDTVYGGGGDDSINGGGGSDIIYGDESLPGATGNDTIHAGLGDDTVYGGAGDDSIFGEAENDSIDGGDGNDTLDGGTGRDTLSGGAGNDLQTGGGDADLFFAPSAGGGQDTITDFGTGSGPLDDGNQQNNDFVDLSGFYNQANYDAAVAAGHINPAVIKTPLQWMRDDLANDGVLNDSYAGWTATRTLTIQNAGAPVAAAALNFDSTNVVCFTHGTKIDTPFGRRPIETLQVGDLVTTLDHGPQTIRWIGRREVPATGRMAPVRIKTGTLGNRRNLFVSQQHRMLLRSDAGMRLFGERELFVPAKKLVDDSLVTIREGGTVCYFHLLFDRHEVILAEGCPAESLFLGAEGWKTMSPEARAEILTLFPGFVCDATGASGYGPLARPMIPKPGQALRLLHTAA